MSVKIDGLAGQLYPPQPGPEPRDALQKFDTYYYQAFYAWNPFFPEADSDLRFYLGDQWDAREQRLLYNEGRSAFVFNKVRRGCDLITGYQRKNRLQSVVVPTEDTDQRVADQMTKLLMHSTKYGDVDRQISDAFAGGVITGWNMLSLWMDYREDPANGDVRVSREPYNAFITDPYFMNLDLSDCQYIMRRKYLPLDMAISLLPKHEERLAELYMIGWDRDDKFTWLPYQQQPNGQPLLAYNEMYEQKWREIPVLIDTETGMFIDWEGPRDRLKYILSMKPSFKLSKRSQRYILLSIIVNNELIEVVENPWGLDEYPLVPFVGVWKPESELWDLKCQSILRNAKSPQRESNRRRSQMIDLLDSQINSGWIATENSVVNPTSLFQTSQGRVVWKRQDAAPDAIQKIPPGQIPPSMFQLQELFDKDVIEAFVVNDAAFGVPDNGNESGVMMMLRQGAAVTGLQEVFDNLRFSQKALSKKMIKMMQSWTPEKMRRILNEDPDPKLYEKGLIKYDIEITEGPLTDSQKQMYFRQLVDLKQLGVPVTAEMLAKAAPIQGKGEFIQDLQQAEQQQAQQAQQAQQIQMQLLQSQAQAQAARAQSDIALSKERFTRAVANMGLEDERISRSVENSTDAMFKRMQIVKELEGMDLGYLEKVFQISRIVEGIQRPREAQVKAEDVGISSLAGAGNSASVQQQPQEGGI